MNKIAEIMRAVAAALGRIVTETVFVTRRVGGKLLTVAETVVRRDLQFVGSVAGVAGSVGKLAVGAASDVVRAPFRIAGTLLAGRQPQQAPEAAAADAERAAHAQQQRADASDDDRQVLAAFRRVVRARADGQVADTAYVGRLPQALLEYVDRLDRDECDILARRSTAELRRVIAGKGQRQDVRSPDQVAPAPAQVVDLAEARAARRTEVRSAVRAAMRGQDTKQETADELLSMVPRRA